MIDYTRDRATDARWVSASPVPVETARAEVARLTAQGRVASWVMIGQDPAFAWVYVDWADERTERP